MPRHIKLTDNYAFLLAGLLFLLFLIPALRMLVDPERDKGLLRALVQGGFSAMMLVGIWSLAREKRVFRLGLGLGLASIAFAVVGGVRHSLWLDLGDSLTVLAFCVVSGFVAAQQVFSGTRVDRNMLYGALCVYLLMGLSWAVVYTMVFDLWPGTFHGVEAPQGASAFDDFLYFSFVTLASLGYGDITPAAPLVRTLAYMEVIAGQFYLAIMVAGLVGLYMQKREG